MALNFKKWLENAGNPSGVDFYPAFRIPHIIAKMYGGAFPSVDMEPLPGNKKMMKKKMKKQKKH